MYPPLIRVQSMFYACLATFFCLLIGIIGLVMAFIDIKNYNFGLYLSLLSVVGTTVSVAFWIVSPAACADPKWVRALLARYGYKLDPLREVVRIHITSRFREDEESGRIMPQRFSPRRSQSMPGRAQESIIHNTIIE